MWVIDSFSQFRTGVSEESDLEDPFLRGDCNDDASVRHLRCDSDSRDAVPRQLDPICSDACDSNDDGDVDISDAIATLDVLFLGGDPLPAPGLTVCGDDPTADALGCDEPRSSCS